MNWTVSAPKEESWLIARVSVEFSIVRIASDPNLKEKNNNYYSYGSKPENDFALGFGYFDSHFFFHLTLIRMLKDNPELYQLYKDLVVSGVITAEEFWANRGKVFTIISTFVQVECASFIPRARCW